MQHWDEPLKWNRLAEAPGVRRKMFCASMADVFEDREDLIPHRERLFDLIDDTPSLDWLLLTKRPENIERLSPRLGQPNVWLGVSAENQRYWNLRVPILLEIPAVVHFVSAEPLLAPIDDELALYPEWLIVGGESGPRFRPMELQWAHSLLEQCRRHGVRVLHEADRGADGPQSTPAKPADPSISAGGATFMSTCFPGGWPAWLKKLVTEPNCTSGTHPELRRIAYWLCGYHPPSQHPGVAFQWLKFAAERCDRIPK